MKIKKGKYNYKGYNKFEIKRIKDFVDSKKNWILLYVTNLIPILFSLLNIFLWLSIYYRISFRIYCSFNYEIRKELRKMKKKEMTTLEEETTNDNNDKIKNNKVEKVEMSVVFEKDRHPSYSKNVMNVKNFGDLKLNKLTTKFQEEFQTGFSSSKRDIKPSFGNNNIYIKNYFLLLFFIFLKLNIINFLISILRINIFILFKLIIFKSIY